MAASKVETRRRALLKEMGDGTWTRTDVFHYARTRGGSAEVYSDLDDLVRDGRVVKTSQAQGGVESWSRS